LIDSLINHSFSLIFDYILYVFYGFDSVILMTGIASGLQYSSKIIPLGSGITWIKNRKSGQLSKN